MKVKASFSIGVASVVVLVGVICATVYMSRQGGSPGVTKETTEKRVSRSVRNTSSKKADGLKGVTNAVRILRAEDPYAPSERRLSDELQSRLDENKLSGIRNTVAKILPQKNSDLKIEAIEALGFFGKEALKDLVAFLKDPDKDVVDAASGAICSALDGLEEGENAFKAEFILTMLSVNGLCKAETVDLFVGQIENIGGSDEKLAVQTVVQLIEDVEVSSHVKFRAREAYEFVTGEKYTTHEAAEKWYAKKLEEEAENASDDAEAEGDSDDDSEKPENAE